MNRRVLFVDDEPQVLRAIERNLSDRFDIATANGGTEAQKMVLEEPAFAVVVSDMRMPGMDGAALLRQLRQTNPSTTRILLTGYADLTATLAAVNEGNIFRFLVKPCPDEVLETAIEDGVTQHQLIVAEKELLERTLMGAIEALTEVLSLVEPALFSRAQRLEQLVSVALDNLGYQPRWPYEMAAKLSQLGCVAVPREIVQRVNSLAGVTDRERALFDSHPETTNRILRTIPRLEIVADVIRFQNAREVPRLERKEVSRGVELLRIAVTLDALMQKGVTREAAVEAVVRRGTHDAEIAKAFLPANTEIRPIKEEGTDWVGLAELKVGSILTDDVLSTSGAVVVPAGRAVTSLVLERLRKFSDGVGIVEPIHILARRGP